METKGGSMQQDETVLIDDAEPDDAASIPDDEGDPGQPEPKEDTDS
jgi:hypothetical protein